MNRHETATTFFAIVRDPSAESVYVAACDKTLQLLTRDILAGFGDVESNVISRDQYLGHLSAQYGIQDPARIEQIRRECEDAVADMYGLKIGRVM